MPIIFVYIGIAVALIGFGGSVGWKVTSDHYEAKAAKDDRVALADFETAVLGMNVLSKALEDSKGEIKVVYRTIERKIPQIIDRPVYRDECLDDDGLRIVAEAFAGKLDNSTKHVERVPAVNSVGGQDGR